MSWILMIMILNLDMNNDVFLLFMEISMLKKIYSLEEQYQLIDISPATLQLILNPYDEVIETAIKKDPGVVQYIYSLIKFDEELQLLAARISGSTLKWIKDASLSVRYAAIYNDGSAIEYIPSPTEEEQLRAIRDHTHHIEYISNPTIRVQLEAIREDITCCTFIKNISLEAQIVSYHICQDNYGYERDERGLWQYLAGHSDIEVYWDIMDDKEYDRLADYEHRDKYELLLKLCPSYFRLIKNLPGILQQLNRDIPYELNFDDYDITFKYE